MSRWRPSGCWAWRNGIASSGVSSRIWSVGGGRCPPLRACWTAQSRATARWSVWSDHRASARAVWCVRSAAMAAARGVEVFTAFCESHTSQSPLPCRGAPVARGHRRRVVLTNRPPAIECAPGFPTQTPRTWRCLMTCWGSPTPILPLPRIDPDARRRRLTALVNAASLARKTPAVYVVEDAHWIDEVSESMLADFLTVIPQTPVAGAAHLSPGISGRVEPGGRCADHRACAT